MTNQQMQRLQVAILAAFDEGELQQLVRFELTEDLATLVAPGAFREVVFECDANKNDIWQPYAALAAAAYVRALLESMPGAPPADPQ